MTPVSENGKYEEFQPSSDFAYAFGLAYSDHIRETAEPMPSKPVIFLKQGKACVEQRTVKTPTKDELIAAVKSADSTLATQIEELRDAIGPMLDYEVELGVQILEDCTSDDLRAGATLPRIGYFLANDVTSRTVQLMGQLSEDRLHCWSACKSFDGFFPCADKLWVPNEAYREELPQVTLELRVNGEVRQHEPTSSLIYSPRELLMHTMAFSKDRRLNAGDLIVTGTPAGVTFQVNRTKRMLAKLLPASFLVKRILAAGRSNPRYLQPGDVVEANAGWLGQHQFEIA